MEIHFAQTVAAYLTSDERANGIVFALYLLPLRPPPGPDIAIPLSTTEYS
ncbi:hypothetical protein AB0N65_09735 [Paenarthrobacter sp. NPDC089322]